MLFAPNTQTTNLEAIFCPTCHLVYIRLAIFVDPRAWRKNNKMPDKCIVVWIAVYPRRRRFVYWLILSVVISHTVSVVNSLPPVENVVLGKRCKQLGMCWCHVICFSGRWIWSWLILSGINAFLEINIQLNVHQ